MGYAATTTKAGTVKVRVLDAADAAVNALALALDSDGFHLSAGEVRRLRDNIAMQIRNVVGTVEA